MRVPRPMICLNSVIELMRLSSTMRWQVCASTPVDMLRGGGNDREGGFGIDEIVELCLAFIVVAGDAHHVALIGGGEVGIGVDQCLAHAFGVVDVFTEHDGDRKS